MATSKYLEWMQFMKLHCQACWTVHKFDFYLSICFTLEKNRQCACSTNHAKCTAARNKPRKAVLKSPGQFTHSSVSQPSVIKASVSSPQHLLARRLLSCQATQPPAPGAAGWGRRSKEARVPSPLPHLPISQINLHSQKNASPLLSEQKWCFASEATHNTPFTGTFGKGVWIITES